MLKVLEVDLPTEKFVIKATKEQPKKGLSHYSVVFMIIFLFLLTLLVPMYRMFENGEKNENLKSDQVD